MAKEGFQGTLRTDGSSPRAAPTCQDGRSLVPGKRHRLIVIPPPSPWSRVAARKMHEEFGFQTWAGTGPPGQVLSLSVPQFIICKMGVRLLQAEKPTPVPTGGNPRRSGGENGTGQGRRRRARACMSQHRAWQVPRAQ